MDFIDSFYFAYLFEINASVTAENKMFLYIFFFYLRTNKSFEKFYILQLHRDEVF